MSNDFFFTCKNLLVSLINLWSPTFILIVGAGCKPSSGEYSDLNGPAPQSRGESGSNLVTFCHFEEKWRWSCSYLCHLWSASVIFFFNLFLLFLRGYNFLPFYLNKVPRFSSPCVVLWEINTEKSISKSTPETQRRKEANFQWNLQL